MKKARILLALAFIFALSGCAADAGIPGTAGNVDSSPPAYEESGIEPAPQTEHSESDPSGDSAPAANAYARYSGTEIAEKAPGVLTAGRRNDNDNWDEFAGVLRRPDWRDYQDDWRMYPSDRIVVYTAQGGKPAVGAQVAAYDRRGDVLWKAVSDNHGAAYLFPSLLGDQTTPAYVEAEYEGQTQGCEIQTSNCYVNLEFDSQQAQATPPALDLMLVIDATGSMDDELEYLKSEFEDVVSRVVQTNNGLPIRTSVNFYRDQGDEFVTRNHEFTSNLDDSLRQLRAQEAADGGDRPEAVDQALSEAVKDHAWEAPTRLMFLVLDAPPHRQGDDFALKNAVVRAASEGIRIIPVAASGTDEETEYLLRTISSATGGQYVFLTDDSGVGNEHEEPTISDYETEYLNNLLVDVINDYLRSYPTVPV